MSLVKIISYNVQGLRDQKKRRKIFWHLHFHEADIVLLQETHSDKKSEKIWKSEWGGRMYFSHGDTNARGVAILLKRKINLKVIKMTRDEAGRFLAMVVECEDKQFIVTVLYAPNKDDPKFFEQVFMAMQSLEVDQKIIGGDFNTVLNKTNDLKGGRGFSNEKTRNFLNEYMQQEHLVDVWRLQDPEVFRATYIARHPVLLRERIDYILISSSLVQNVDNSDILPMFISDHALPTISICIVNNRPGKGYWKLNNTLLDNEDLIVDIQNAIGNVFVDLHDKDIFIKWEMMKLSVRECARKKGIELAKSRNNKLQVLQRKLVQIAKDRDGENNGTMFNDHDRQFQLVSAEIEELTQFKVNGSMLRSQANWTEFGERPSGYFTNLEKHRFNKKTITRIRDPKNNAIVDTEEEIARVLNEFYTKLYQCKGLELDPDYLALLDVPQISEKDKYMLDGPIQLEEIHIALKQMNKSKCPGLDGLTVEFYLKFWPWLAKHIHALFVEITKCHILHRLARDGIISLLDKPGKDLLDVLNWRPLTLLNVDYKLYSKVLVNRMEHVINDIVHQDQTGFIKGRSISDNVLDLLTIIEHCKDNDLPALVISVDFYKVYDSVAFSAIEQILNAFNFGETFIKMVMTCFNDIRSNVMNNNKWSQK